MTVFTPVRIAPLPWLPWWRYLVAVVWAALLVVAWAALPLGEGFGGVFGFHCGVLAGGFACGALRALVVVLERDSPEQISCGGS